MAFIDRLAVIGALSTLSEPRGNGVTEQQILNFMTALGDKSTKAEKIKTALKAGVEAGVFKKNGQFFTFSNELEPEEIEAAEESQQPISVCPPCDKCGKCCKCQNCGTCPKCCECSNARCPPKKCCPSAPPPQQQQQQPRKCPMKPCCLKKRCCKKKRYYPKDSCEMESLSDQSDLNLD